MKLDHPFSLFFLFIFNFIICLIYMRAFYLTKAPGRGNSEPKKKIPIPY